MSEESKTLEAYLAPPTRHKQRKLHDEHERYGTLLHRSFNEECDTMSAVNEVVSGEDLNWHSKNALKKYVPNLLDEDTYGAKQLADDHPIRYANTAAVFDVDEDRHHSICWEVPLSGRAHQDTPSSEELPSAKRASDDKGSSSSPAVGAGTGPETGDAHTS
ncbi:hypothetical protein [Halomicrococcus sp. NG-SE-24]|uniref:hypothetical protein n=1 Tax=Halomicrococcus sp. NG-SE-24 TaxID=3436928 RepID=UPI003D99B65F